jgi:two-component system OmpR family response regulator
MKKILLLEDDACLRSILREFLLRENYAVIIAKNALIGLQFAAQLEPDLIISDLNIPYLNGYTVLKQLRTHLKTSKIPFILIASDHTGEKRSYALELGANDYLIKPFKCQELLQAIATQFSQKIMYPIT